MSNTLTTPWQGGWQLRLRSKLDELGFGTLEHFLAARPGTSYVKLAQELDANVAAMQIYGEQVRAAVYEERLRDAAMDSLGRFLKEHMKRGWGRGQHFAFRLASAFGDWKSVVIQFGSGDENLKAKLDAVTEALKANGPPEGWMPAKPNDEFILRAFEEGWPT